MTDKRTFVPDGKYPELRIRITKKPEAPTRFVSTPHSKNPQGNYPPYVFQYDPVPQGGKNIYFYDLGTRLRTVTDVEPTTADSVELRSRIRFRDAIDTPISATTDEPLLDHTLEYLEVAVDGQATDLDAIDPDNLDLNGGNLGTQAELPAAIITALDKAMLGSRWRDPAHPADPPADLLDPLGFTKAVGSLRKIPNCAPIPYETQRWGGGYDDALLAIDVELYKGEDAPQRLICAAHQRPKIEELGDPRVALITNTKWKKRTANPDKDALERWNPLNTLDDTTGLNQGYIESKGLGGGYNLRIKSRLQYEEFDTGDAVNYKVTSTPYFSGSEVPFKYSGGNETHIYLKPKYLCATPVFSWQRHHHYTYRSAYYGSMTTLGFRNYAHVFLNMDTQNFVFVTGTQIEFDYPYADVGVEVTVTHSLTDADNEGTCNGVHVVQGTNYDGIISGMRLTFVFTPHGPTGDPWEGDGHGVTQYNYIDFSVNVTLSLSMNTGPFAFRSPIYSRPPNADWHSVYDYTGGAADDTGRVFGFNYSGLTHDKKLAIFQRVFEWNAWMFAQVVTHALFKQLDLIGCFGSAATPRVLTPYGDDTPLIDWFTTEKGEVETCAPTVPYMDGGLVDPGGDDITTVGDFNFLNAFPPKTLRVGQLMGIINSGGAIYYIWRKTELDQSAPDYQRDNFQGNLT
jgi:hypothetical protein